MFFIFEPRKPQYHQYIIFLFYNTYYPYLHTQKNGYHYQFQTRPATPRPVEVVKQTRTVTTTIKT